MVVRVIRTSKADASWFYRVELPMRALARAGHTVECLPDSVPMPGGCRFADAVLHGADILVLLRAGKMLSGSGEAADVAAAIRDARARGVCVIHDNDDLLTELPESNPAHEDWAGRWKDLHTQCLVAATALTAATENLARALGAHNANTFVVPNRLPAFSDQFPDKSRLFSVVLTGSYSHFPDWSVVVEDVVRWVNGRDDARLVTIGFDPVSLKGLRQEWVHVQDAIERCRRVASVGWLEYGQYLQAMARCHVVVAPLLDTPFNRCKSAIKAMEAAMCRCIALLSPVGEYVDWLARYGEAGICYPMDRGNIVDLLDRAYDTWRSGRWPVDAMFDAATAHRYDAREYIDAVDSIYRQARLLP